MKKIVSIILAVLMIMSVATAFASDVTYPENLAQECYAGSATKVDLGTTTKVDTTVATVTAAGATSPFGEPGAILDGVGMIGSYIVDADGNVTSDLITEKMAAGTAVTNAKNRWGAAKGETPTITIDFGKEITFDTIKFTEARRIIGEYKITWYNDGVACTTPYTDAFADATTVTASDNYLYSREISLGQIITTNKINFEVVSLQRNTQVLSIAEMEFWSNPVIASAEGTQNSTGGGVYKIFDGANMITTDKSEDAVPANIERLIFAKDTPFTITASFAKDITLNTIKFTEYKARIKNYEVSLYKDGVKIGGKTDSLSYPTATVMYLRTIALDQTYTVDSIVFEAKDFHKSDTVHILEMEFYDGVTAPTVTTNGELEIIKGDATALFDGIYDSDGTISDGILQIRAHDADNNENLLNDLTITFDLGSEKTFNYAELAERRCVLGEIEVQYKNASGEWVPAGIIPEQEYVNSNVEIIRSTSFDAVTARYVRFVVKNIAAFDEILGASSMRTININEIVLANYEGTGAEATIYPIRAYGAAIDGLSSDLAAGTTRVNANVMLTNSSSKDKEYKVIATHYSAAGILDKVSINSVAVPTGKSKVVNTILYFNNESETLTEDTVSYMVWDGVTLAPLCAQKTIPAN